MQPVGPNAAPAHEKQEEEAHVAVEEDGLPLPPQADEKTNIPE